MSKQVPPTTAQFIIDFAGEDAVGRVVIDRAPGSINMSLGRLSEGVVRMNYRADGVYTIHAQSEGPVWTSLDFVDVPSSVDAVFSYSQASGGNQLDADYAASGVLTKATVSIASSAERTDYLLLEVDAVPQQMTEHMRTWSTPTGIAAHVEHSASAPLARVFGYGQVGGDWGLVLLEGVPATLSDDVVISGDSRTLDAAHLVHNANGFVASAYARGSYRGSEGFLYVENVPRSVDLFAALRDESGSRASPAFRYVGSDAGMSVRAFATGELLRGGRVDLTVIDIPTRVSTTFPTPGWDEVGRVFITTEGSGPIGRVDVDAFLPALLADKPIKQVTLHFEQLQSLDIRQKQPLAPACLGCQYWEERRAGDFWLAHGELPFGGFYLNVWWKIDQCPAFSSIWLCDASGGWAPRYFMNVPNMMRNDPASLSYADHTRAAVSVILP